MQSLAQKNARVAPARAAQPARVSVVARSGRPTPPDLPKDEMGAVGREWLATILSRFGPVKEKAAMVTTLEFEKPLLELDKRIKEVRMRCRRERGRGAARRRSGG